MGHVVKKASVYAAKGNLTLASSASVNANGDPVKRYTKDLIRIGDYHKSSTNQSFSFSEKDLVAFARTFADMKAGGVRVPVPATHTDDPEANRGYVEDMYVSDGTLYGVIELIGADAIALAGRAEVSIYAVPEFVDGKGKKYKNAIEHVALVTNPVIPEQGGFVPITLSHGNIKALAYEPGAPGASNVVQKIAAALGVPTEGVDETQLEAAILAKIEAMKPKKDEPGEVAKAQEAVKAARAELDAYKLSRTTGETNPQIIKLAGKNRTAELSRLRNSGKITVATEKALHATWVGADNTALRLSLDADSDAKFEATIAALEHSCHKELHGILNQNTVALSRETPGDSKSVDEKASDAMAARLSGNKA